GGGGTGGGRGGGGAAGGGGPPRHRQNGEQTLLHPRIPSLVIGPTVTGRSAHAPRQSGRASIGPQNREARKPGARKSGLPAGAGHAVDAPHQAFLGDVRDQRAGAR